MKAITPDNHEHWLKLRSEDVTSTECSSLFGLSPYMTEFELWHRKKNQEIVTLEETERMRWGNRLEAAIANGIAEDQSWTVKPFKDYARNEELRAGSSFDFIILSDEITSKKDGLTHIKDCLPIGLLEIKNVDALQFKEKWVIEDGQVVEAPPHIEIQVQHQLMITGFQVAYIGALVGGNSVGLIRRTPQENIISQIKSKITKFWDSIENNQPPAPDFERDADFISSLYDNAEPGKTMDVCKDEEMMDLVAKYKDATAMEKAAATAKQAAKAQILTKIGDAEKIFGDSFTISAGVVGPAQVAYERKGYRNFRVHFKKNKEAK